MRTVGRMHSNARVAAPMEKTFWLSAPRGNELMKKPCHRARLIGRLNMNYLSAALNAPEGPEDEAEDQENEIKKKKSKA